MKDKGHQVILSFGSNLGDSLLTIEKAYNELEANGIKILEKSSFYTSPPWGFQAENDFINSIALAETNLSLVDLLALNQLIEKGLGRNEKPTDGYESRSIDIDIIDFGGQIFLNESIQIPHAACHLRAFVLLPLQEICPGWKHPKLKMSIAEMLVNYSVDLNTSKI